MITFKNINEGEKYPDDKICLGLLYSGEKFRGFYFKYKTGEIQYRKYTCPYTFNVKNGNCEKVFYFRLDKVQFKWKNLVFNSSTHWLPIEN